MNADTDTDFEHELDDEQTDRDEEHDDEQTDEDEELDDPIEAHRRAMSRYGNSPHARRDLGDDFDPVRMHRRWMGLR